jgi:hypothetical protein
LKYITEKGFTERRKKKIEPNKSNSHVKLPKTLDATTNNDLAHLQASPEVALASLIPFRSFQWILNPCPHMSKK